MSTESTEQENTPRVLIADDHALFRQILSLSLEDAGINVIGTASTGRQAVDLTLEHKPDCVLLDVVLPEMDGLAALSIIKYLSPDTPVIIVTAVADPLYMARARELGAEVFFSKGVSADELVDTIRALHSGLIHVGSFVRKMEPTAPSVPGPHLEKEVTTPKNIQDLTDKEKMVLSLIAMGLTNPAIENKLDISKNTVKTHMRNIFSKLGVSDRTQAAVWAFHNGYIAVSEGLNEVTPRSEER